MFNVGDLVRGISGSDYTYTGEGSLCRVIAVLLEDEITVELIHASPRHPSMRDGRQFTVYARYFTLEGAEGVAAVKVQGLRFYDCGEGVRGHGVCGEPANKRLTVKGFSGTFCAAHARPYIEGRKILTFRKCSHCRKTFKGDSPYGEYCSGSCSMEGSMPVPQEQGVDPWVQQGVADAADERRREADALRRRMAVDSLSFISHRSIFVDDAESEPRA